MFKFYCGSDYGLNRQKKFTDVFETFDIFKAEYQNSKIPQTLKEQNFQTLYYLLYGNFGNSTIASSDINQFKYKLFGIIFQYGPTWERRLEIQSRIRLMQEDELLRGSRQVYNKAENNSTPAKNEPKGTYSEVEINFIHDQSVAHNKKGLLEGYANLVMMLDDRITEEFLDKFRLLFKTFVEPELPLLYGD